MIGTYGGELTKTDSIEKDMSFNPAKMASALQREVQVS